MNIFSAGGAKLAAFPEKVAAWRAGSQISPILVEIHPSEQCGHRCPMCQAHYAIPRREMKARARSGVHLNLETLASVWENPPLGVVLSGNTGDPLRHPQISVLMNQLLSRSIPTVLITNGEALTPEVAELALRTCRGIRVSLDAHDAASFALTHGRRGDAWQRVLDAITLLVETKAKLCREPCVVGVGYLTKSSTRDGMLPAAILAKGLGVDYIQFRPYHESFDDVGEQLAECKKIATNRFKVLSSDQKYERFESVQRDYSRCHGAWFFSVIDARSDVYVCCHHVGNERARIGSLKSDKWSDILSSARRRDAIRQFPLSSCVPLCRLHSHNTTLENSLRSGGGVIAAELSEDVRAHSVFL